MNLKYYVTPEEAEKVIAFLNKYKIGEGVKGGLLNEWVGPFSVPVVAGKQMLLIRLNNNAKLNAGLVLDMMGKGYPEFLVADILKAGARPEPPEEE
jgi:hypothetical protein